MGGGQTTPTERDTGEPDDRPGSERADTDAPEAVELPGTDRVADESGSGGQPAETDQQPVAVGSADGADEAAGDGTAAADPSRMTLGTHEALVADLADRVESLDEPPTAMLRHVRSEGPVTPVEAHVAAGGNADRELAYGRIRRLRRAGLVDHVGRGNYAYALPALVREEYDDRLHESDLADVLRAVEAEFVENPVHGWTLADVDEAGAPDAAVTDPDAEFVDADEDALTPAFREEDVEFVDEAEFVDEPDRGEEAPAPDDDSASDAARSGAPDDTDRSSVTASGDPRDGQDAEIIE
ncbi:MAG: hypothetical protein A07HB70_00856 [uncultured archaeon A07HB70]|nr:MAG: hypothetical protein A07HB70_00856 [uncultured archaeon A07HB70]